MSDLSNGAKFGQSTIYDSGQYNQDMMMFRKLALGDSSEFSGDYSSGEMSGIANSGMNNTGEFKNSGPQGQYGGRL